MNATRLYLVRHGETEWNNKDVFRGHSDVPLNENGKTQAIELGQAFAAAPLRGIYTSPLRRAAETAGAVASARDEKRSVQIVAGLIDINRGEWEGVSRYQVKAKHPALYEQWLHFPTQVRFPGGDELKDVERRSRAAVEKIASELHGAASMIVTHHVVIRVLLCSLLELDLSSFRRFEALPASVSELRLEYGRWVLHRLNDVSHLGGVVLR